MPLYDFECECGKTAEHWAGFDEKEIPCECGKDMRRLITSNYNIHADFASSDFVTDNITGDPIRITSNKQLRNLCKEHDVYQKIGKGWY